MHIERTELLKARRACLVFFICLVAVFPVSFLNAYCGTFLPRQLAGNPFFAWLDSTILLFPRYVFPRGFGAGMGGAQLVIPAAVSISLSILFWIIVGLGCGWLMRRLRLVFAIPITAVVIFLVTFVAHTALYSLFRIEAVLPQS